MSPEEIDPQVLSKHKVKVITVTDYESYNGFLEQMSNLFDDSTNEFIDESIIDSLEQRTDELIQGCPGDFKKVKEKRYEFELLGNRQNGGRKSLSFEEIEKIVANEQKFIDESKVNDDGSDYTTISDMRKSTTVFEKHNKQGVPIERDVCDNTTGEGFKVRSHYDDRGNQDVELTEYYVVSEGKYTTKKRTLIINKFNSSDELVKASTYTAEQGRIYKEEVISEYDGNNQLLVKNTFTTFGGERILTEKVICKYNSFNLLLERLEYKRIVKALILLSKTITEIEYYNA